MGSGLYTLRLESLEPKAWIRILFEPIIQAAAFAGGINNNVEVIALILIVIATAICSHRETQMTAAAFERQRHGFG